MGDHFDYTKPAAKTLSNPGLLPPAKATGFNSREGDGEVFFDPAFLPPGKSLQTANNIFADNPDVVSVCASQALLCRGSRHNWLASDFAREHIAPMVGVTKETVSVGLDFVVRKAQARAGNREGFVLVTWYERDGSWSLTYPRSGFASEVWCDSGDSVFGDAHGMEPRETGVQFTMVGDQAIIVDQHGGVEEFIVADCSNLGRDAAKDFDFHPERWVLDGSGRVVRNGEHDTVSQGRLCFVR